MLFQMSYGRNAEVPEGIEPTVPRLYPAGYFPGSQLGALPLGYGTMLAADAVPRSLTGMAKVQRPGCQPPVPASIY